jgi:hypothetical protein
VRCDESPTVAIHAASNDDSAVHGVPIEEIRLTVEAHDDRFLLIRHQREV